MPVPVGVTRVSGPWRVRVSVAAGSLTTKICSYAHVTLRPG